MLSPSSDINPCHSVFLDRHHLQSNMGITFGPEKFAVNMGIISVWSGIIYGPIWVSFAVQYGIICDLIWGLFAVQYGDHLWSGIIRG